jgi:hypothetical protein
MPTLQAIFLREYFFLPPKKNFIFSPIPRCFNFFATPQQSTTDKHLDRKTQETNRLQHYTDEEARTGKTGLAKVAVQCSADTFVVNQSLIIRINICGESHHLRQARKC